MRITGGQARGRLLASPRGQKIRPTADHIREAIFNIIGQDLSGLKVLDLFAGTGSFGLEALSRGALSVLFIDNSRESTTLTRKNLMICGYVDAGIVLRRELKKGLPADHPHLKKGVDLVFIDPPYEKGSVPPLLRQLSTGDLLSRGSRVITESRKTEKLPAAVGNLRMTDTRSYGDTRISVYEYEVNNE